MGSVGSVGSERRRVNGRHRRQVEAALEELAEILSGAIPVGITTNERFLAARLQEDDALARAVWSHPMYVGLVTWAKRWCPRAEQVWDDMAVYALTRSAAFQSSEAPIESVRSGMLATAAWVKYRGRASERSDRSEASLESIALVAEPLVEAPSAVIVEPKPNPVEYLAQVLGAPLPPAAARVLEEAWEVAQAHYLWLADLTGLRGEALLEAGQSQGSVSRHRRLSRRLPESWPDPTRKAVAHLFGGTPRNAGMLLWWATTPAQELPLSVRSRWRGLITAIDPTVGQLPDRDRRLRRERAQRWKPQRASFDGGIAV